MGIWPIFFLFFGILIDVVLTFMINSHKNQTSIEIIPVKDYREGCFSFGI